MEALQFVGESAAMCALRPEIDRTAASNAKVLITGESGVGKEVVARHIHAASPRRAAPLVAINCAGVPDSLLESELFGYLRGSFTDAYRDKSGLLETADRGTVFLDEVGEMTPRMQGLLLRFLETGEVQRVGSTHADLRVDVRVIAATNRDLAQAVSDGSFRQDLYYRLNVIHLRVPPLRDRVEDIRPLLEHFTRICCSQAAVPALGYSADAMSMLLAYRWPGNIRELKNVVERLVVGVRSGSVEPTHLPLEVRQSAANAAALRPAGTRSDTVDTLFTQMTRGRKSFWSVAYVPFMQRDLTRADLRALVSRGLAETSGEYTMLARLFNVDDVDYRRFLNALRKHQCFVPVAHTRVGRSHAAS